MTRRDGAAELSGGTPEPSPERKAGVAKAAVTIVTHAVKIITLARALHWAWEWVIGHLSSEG